MTESALKRLAEPFGPGGSGLGDAVHAVRFDVFEFDPRRSELRGADGGAVTLRPKTELLLRCLLAEPGRLLSKDELMQRLWPAAVVTDDSLVQCVGELRHALGDAGPRLIRTVPRRGYRLECAVTGVGHGGDAGEPAEGRASHAAPPPVELLPTAAISQGASAMAAAPAAPPLRGLPRSTRTRWLAAVGVAMAMAMAVAFFVHQRSRPMPFHIDDVIAARATYAIMPFEVAGGDPALRRLADAVADDIAAQFSTRIGMRGLSRAATSTLAASGLAPVKVAATLNATGAVTGRIVGGLTSPTSATIDVQLLTGANGAVFWAGHYEQPDASATAGLEQIGRQVVNAVRSATSKHEIERSEAADASLDPAQLTLRGWTDLDRRVSIEDAQRARRRFKRALSADPDSKIALHGYAGSFGYQASEPGGRLTGAERAEEERAVEHLIRIAPEDSNANMSWALTQLGRSRPDVALPAIDKAIRIVPSYPGARVLRAETLLLLGRTREVQAEAERAVAIAQADSRRASAAFTVAAEAAIMLGEYERARDLARRAFSQFPGNFRAAGALAAAEALTGQDAGASLTTLHKLWPGATVANYDRWRTYQPDYVEQRARFHEGLRRAGLPEG